MPLWVLALLALLASGVRASEPPLRLVYGSGIAGELAPCG